MEILEQILDSARGAVGVAINCARKIIHL